ncbi:unnamed protein product [Paramecium sonneborni]|uniref:Matrin-type domain-containing protein n=1 Tax=Paramecium sonneborni TaxID=65129 RepID=A0A8S1RI28_9CILI|nr:unnamed protein product [Paramecium sonneborni]
MDMQNRPGGRTGSGPMASAADANVERRERLKQLAMEIIDLQKDPYFMINHLGTYECKLCLTLHTNEGSYLAHTQGKKHQQNLLRRKAREGKDLNAMMHMAKQNQPKPQKHKTVKIGRPGYKVTRTVENTSKVLYFELYYEDIQPGFIPKHRVMSAFEQKIEQADKNYQYLIFAGEPYENVGFKIPNQEIETQDGKFQPIWDKDKKIYSLRVQFREKKNNK